jgi:hypothetical protein
MRFPARQSHLPIHEIIEKAKYRFQCPVIRFVISHLTKRVRLPHVNIGILIKISCGSTAEENEEASCDNLAVHVDVYVKAAQKVATSQNQAQASTTK